jgi:hypothetical protein
MKKRTSPSKRSSSPKRKSPIKRKSPTRRMKMPFPMLEEQPKYNPYEDLYKEIMKMISEYKN